jgi:hypothetical protein
VVHRTVSGAAGWHLRTCCSRDFVGGVRLKITGLSGESTVSRANGRPKNPRATRGKCQRSDGAPDCPVRQRLQDCNGRLRQVSKEVRTGQCPVVHRTIRCARRHKARIAFLECSQQLLAAFGAIKGTPRRMEEHTKHSLSIPKHQDFDSAHLILCDSN